MLPKLISKLFSQSDEDGAVTVDWVVLTAAMVILAGSIGLQMRVGTLTAIDEINEAMLDSLE